MVKLESLESVGFFVNDLKAAKRFFTRTIGLKVREEERKWGYLALGATKGGEDASLDPWQPSPEWGTEMYEFGRRQIGTVTGIGFRTNDFAGTLEMMRRRGVKVVVEGEAQDFARFKDSDGNAFFFSPAEKVKRKRAGLAALEWVTVVTRDAARSGEFFTKALGMRGRRIPGEEGFIGYRLSTKGTSILPFAPTREMYPDPKDYDADMAHLGEDTAISFQTRDIYKLQEALMDRGVRFSEKAEKRDWGGIRARFLDPDDNVYSIIQY